MFWQAILIFGQVECGTVIVKYLAQKHNVAC